MNLEKLKDTARKFEQKEDWRKAIEVYLKAVQQIESGAETSPDLSLYNRVGDLYLKINDIASAVRSYERAVDLYADQGFFNNAIALCGKILRVNPGRTQTYLKLAQLHARKNVVIEAKRNLIEFMERMNALGQLELAFTSVKEFADQFSGSQEIRIMLVELLRAASREDEAQEQLEKLAGELEARGDRSGARRVLERLQEADAEAKVEPASTVPRVGGLVFLDTGADLPASHPAPAEASPSSSAASPPDGLMVTEPVVADAGLADQPVVEDLIIDPLTPTAAETAEAVPGLERAEEVDLDDFSSEAEPLDIVREEVPEVAFEGVRLEGMDEPEVGSEEPDLGSLLDTEEELIVSLTDSEPGAESPDDLDQSMDLDLVEPEVEDAGAPAATSGLPLIPVEVSGGDSTTGVTELEDQVVDDPDNPELHRQLAGRLMAAGEDARALEEFELALAGFERLENWPAASAVGNRLVALWPDNIRHHQKRVELAYRMGERGPLLDAYLSLGDTLARGGATDMAIAVYGRVQEHDPGNARAVAAIEALSDKAAKAPKPAETTSQAPTPAPAAIDTSFVDLGSMVFDESAPMDTRMRIDRQDPKDEDEQREFKEILEQFKRGIEQNLDTEDFQAHYDLGVAFKEMGLLDEAIAEFQKALRAPEGKLRTSEALGICFFEKGQFAISETVLRRGVEGVEGGDDAKIGLLYWLGRAAEAQGKDGEAIASYERALAVDIRFMDLGERIQRLTAGRRE